MVLVERDRPELTGVDTAVRKTSPAGAGNIVTAHGALIARDVYDLYNVRVILVAAHRQFYALAEDRALFVYTTAHGRYFAGHDL